MSYKISVVIPVYNVEKYIKTTLDSILNQTLKDFEIICVDSSSDSSFEILKEYQEKYNNIKLIKHDGIYCGQARNEGLEQASGEYVLFLDADDYFYPQMFEKMYHKAIENNTDITICSARKYDENLEYEVEKYPTWPINYDNAIIDKIFSYKDCPDVFFDCTIVVPWTKLFKREFLIKNNLKFPYIKTCEDGVFGLQSMVAAERIIIFDDVLVKYRCNHQGSSQYFRGEYTLDILHAAIMVKGFLYQRGLFELLKKTYYRFFNAHIFWNSSFCNDEQYERFLERFEETLLQDYNIFSCALRKDYITIDFLKKITENKKVMFWGCSLFIEEVLKNGEKLPNLIGFIDKNPDKKGEKFCGYEIFIPDDLNVIKPDMVVMTIHKKNDEIYEIIKKEFDEKYKDIELAKNIFFKKNYFQ